MDNIKKVTVDQLKGKTFYNDKKNAANKVHSVKVNLNYFEGDGSELYVDTNTGLIKKIYPDGRDDVYMAYVDVDQMNFDDLDAPVEEIATEEIRKNTDQPIVPGEEAPTSSSQDKIKRDEEIEFGNIESNEVQMEEYNNERPEIKEQVLVKDEGIQATTLDTKDDEINFEAEEELPVEEIITEDVDKTNQEIVPGEEDLKGETNVEIEDIDDDDLEEISNEKLLNEENNEENNEEIQEEEIEEIVTDEDDDKTNQEIVPGEEVIEEPETIVSEGQGIRQDFIDEIDDRFKRLSDLTGNYGKKGWKGKCSFLARMQLVDQGIISQDARTASGKDLAYALGNNFGTINGQKNIGVNITGSGKETFEQIIKDNNGSVSNMVISFAPYGSFGDTAGHGHAMLVSKIENGMVYYIDDFNFEEPKNNRTDPYVHCVSIETFESWYFGRSKTNYITYYK